LILLNDSIDFVEQFQWICSTISLGLFRQIGGLPVRERCADGSDLMVLANESGNNGLRNQPFGRFACKELLN